MLCRRWNQEAKLAPAPSLYNYNYLKYSTINSVNSLFALDAVFQFVTRLPEMSKMWLYLNKNTLVLGEFSPDPLSGLCLWTPSETSVPETSYPSSPHFPYILYRPYLL